MYEIKNLKELLTSQIGNDFEILERKSQTLTPPGEHYGSIMVSLELLIKKQNQTEKVYLVAKFLPASELLRAAFDTDVTFKKEIIAYTEIIPAFLKFQKEYNIPDNKLLDVFPKCYGARLNIDNNQNQVGEDAVLIFENLKIDGYTMYNRFDGFDYETAKLIMKDLSKFHGVALAMKLLKPDDFEEIVGPCLERNKGLDNIPKEIEDAMYYSVITICEQIPEVSKYSKRLEKVFLESKEIFRNVRTPRYAWGTLVHGDYWGNNTMVKYDKINEKPIKNKIVDLQILEYDSIVHDMLFFLFTSVNNKVLSEKYDDLIKTYHNNLIDTLNDFKEIDLKPYNWHEFLIEIDQEIRKECFHIFFMLKFIFAEKGKIKSLEEFQPSDWSRKDLIGENHREKLKATVLEFINRNWI